MVLIMGILHLDGPKLVCDRTRGRICEVWIADVRQVRLGISVFSLLARIRKWRYSSQERRSKMGLSID